jgi:hypothetical protein
VKHSIAVEPLHVGESLAEPYDWLFVTLGYEERARHVAQSVVKSAARRTAWAFDDNKVLSYRDNEAFLRSERFEIVEEGLGSPQKWIAEAAEHGEVDRCVVRVAVDVSSGSRRRIAQWIEAASMWNGPSPFEVDFLYAMARFAQPAEEEVPNTEAGPVLRSFAGWATNPAAPAILILGLGYERDQAIGAVEYIEPAEVWAFDPSGADAEYSSSIKLANEQLWSMRPKAPRRIRYDPAQVFQTFGVIEGLLASLVRRSRPVILPFGPKVFALAALLAARFHPETAVWRVSAGASGRPVQRTASGVVVGLRVRFDVDKVTLGA